MPVARRVLVGVALAGAVLSPAGPAGADATYPPAVHVVLGTLSEASIVDGRSVVLSGAGFEPGASVRVSVDGVQRRVVRADTSGVVSVPVVLNGVGTHSVAAAGREPGGRLRVASDPVTVLAAATSTVPPTALPAPAPGPGLGRRPLPALLAGLGLVALAAATFVLSRRRAGRSLPAAR